MSSKERKLSRLNPDEPRPTFDCGDDDLNEYFHADSITACKELVAVSYALFEGDKVIAYYCVSNDAITRYLTTGTFWKKIQKMIQSPEKRYASLPAVKVGRFGVARDYIGQNIGSQLMSGIKYDFVNGNKTGCRFIIVDAYNKERVINFYKKNGFEFMTQSDKGSDTRLMFFDLIQFANSSVSSLANN